MNRFLVDTRKVWGSPLVIVAVGLLIIVGIVVGGHQLSPETALTRGAFQVAVSYSYSSGYDFMLHVFNWAGQPIAGASVGLTLLRPNSSQVVGTPQIAFTDSSGNALIAMYVPSATYTANLNVSSSGAADFMALGIHPVGNGSIVGGPGTISVVDPGTLRLTPRILVAFAYPNGSVPSGVLVLASLGNRTGTTPGFYNYTLGELVQSPMTFSIGVAPAWNESSSVTVSLMSGGVVILSQEFDPVAFQIVEFPQTAIGQLFAVAESNFAVFAPMAGVMLGYSAYARERVTRALEPLWAMPLGHGWILMRRYASAALALAAGTAAGSAAIALGFLRTLGFSPPLQLTTGFWVGMFVSSLAFLGIAVIISHLSREPAAVLGASIGPIVTFSVLWPAVVASLAHAGLGADGLLAVNPSQLTTGLADGLAGFLAGVPGALSMGGGSSLSLELTSSLCWAVVPVIGALLLAKYRD